MSVNKNQPHVFVLPEDRANRQLANGFHLQVPWNRRRQMQVLEEVGGWNRVLDVFESEHVTEMLRCEHRLMVLLIDFDNMEDRRERAMARIPQTLYDRVFILGTWTQPEALKQALGSYEKIGSDMAQDCRENTDKIWAHPLLRHNASELDRLREHVLPILFQTG